MNAAVAQVPPERWNVPPPVDVVATVNVMAVSGAPPMFRSVSVCAALVVDTIVPANDSEAGLTTPRAVVGAGNSTAPMSAGAVRALPKKSVVGMATPGMVAPDGVVALGVPPLTAGEPAAIE